MDEKRYRGSRLCRLLGNPVAYQLVVFLDGDGPLTPSKLAKLTGRQISTISSHLAKLRAADVVRYDIRGREVRYLKKVTMIT
ncbi:MAG: helix-turn-helix transcriptional regulator [Deltaproteobacteria bacterium]|nr:MAG: helix-turn-helix transcriptional regulator [Deltaproteobacteria bacterium]